jgi:hypothetical protein
MGRIEILNEHGCLLRRSYGVGSLGGSPLAEFIAQAELQAVLDV